MVVRLAGLGYISSSMSRWGPVLDYPFQTRGLDADVVVFGDSTAFLGIDPRIVNADLGIHSVVLPNTLGSLPVTGDLALQSYLHLNRKPRLIVFYFAPWNLDYLQNNQQRLYFEGIETLIRSGSWNTLASFSLHHPLAVLAFPMQIQSTLDARNVKSALHGGKTGDIQDALGHFDYTEPWPPVQEGCAIPPQYVDRTTVTSVQDLVRKYSSQGFNVAVYLAPIPACRNAGLFARRTYGGLTLRGPAVLAPSSFAQDQFYGHLRPEAVSTASHLFSEALRTRADMARPLSLGSGPLPASKLR